jgi:hypothetical protein
MMLKTETEYTIGRDGLGMFYIVFSLPEQGGKTWPNVSHKVITGEHRSWHDPFTNGHRPAERMEDTCNPGTYKRQTALRPS